MLSPVIPPRPVYRWKTFWFGILILAFIGWAWIDSMKHYSGILYAVPPQNIFVARQHAGSVVLGWDTSEQFGVHEFQSAREPSSPYEHTPWFPKAAAVEKHGANTTASIAHWYLLLNSLLLWAVFLAWRRQRLKRLATSTAEPPARSSSI